MHHVQLSRMTSLVYWSYHILQMGNRKSGISRRPCGKRFWKMEGQHVVSTFVLERSYESFVPYNCANTTIIYTMEREISHLLCTILRRALLY